MNIFFRYKTIKMHSNKTCTAVNRQYSCMNYIHNENVQSTGT